MNFLKRFLVGMAVFLQLSSPVITETEDGLSVSLSITSLLTEEMQTLLENGVSFRFELYYSMILVDFQGDRILLKRERVIELNYDFITDSYYLNNGSVTSFDSMNDLEEAARRFPDMAFILDKDRFSKAEMFFQISIIDNPILEDEFGIETDSLWNYYKPSISTTWELPE